MKNRLLLPLGILALVAPILLLKPSRLAGMQAPAQGITIRGTVTRTGTAEPIADVQVSISAGRGGFVNATLEELQQAVEASRAGGLQVSPAALQRLEALQDQARGGTTAPAPVNLDARTDRDGKFSLANVPPGTYQLRAEREGYFGAPNGPLASAPPQYIQQQITIAAGQPQDLALSLTPGGAISGTAVDSEARPIVGAQVQLYRLAYQNGSPVLQNAANPSATDDRGVYRLFRIPPGDYYLEVTPSGAGGRGGFSSGVRGAVPPKQGLVRTFYPDATEAAKGRLISLHAGEEMNGVAIAVRTSPLITVSGTVVSSVPLPSSVGPRGQNIVQSPSLILVPRNKNSIETSSGRSVGSANMEPPSNGQFQLTGIAPGSYDVFARVFNINQATGPAPIPGQQPTEPNYYFGRTTLEAGFQDLQGLTIAMNSGVELKAYATIDGSTAAVPGNVRINLNSIDSGRYLPAYAGGNVAAQPVTGADGSVTIPFVNEGAFRFQVNVNAVAGGGRGQRGNTPYVEDIREGGVSVYDNGLIVGKRAPQPIEVIIKTNGGTIEGDAYDSKQQLKPQAVVVLVPPANRRQNPALYRQIQTNAAGHFSMRGIQPGQYKLFAFESVANGAYQNAEFIAKVEEFGSAVLVNAASTTTAQVKLVPSK